MLQDIRIKSLQCLYEIANCYRTVYLLPYKQDVLIDLAPALDDKKRLVRSTAVKARRRWFLIGSPGEAKDNWLNSRRRRLPYQWETKVNRIMTDFQYEKKCMRYMRLFLLTMLYIHQIGPCYNFYIVLSENLKFSC